MTRNLLAACAFLCFTVAFMALHPAESAAQTETEAPDTASRSAL